MMNELVLSLFPGIGIMDHAFEAEGYCMVRGPDLLWGGDIRRFHPPPGVFRGLVGGPPCQAHSQLVHVVRHRYGDAAVAEDLIPEFVRVVVEAKPAWFVMENVEHAPIPDIPGYHVDASLLDNRWIGGEQRRLHRFCFGTRDGRQLDYSPDIALFENPEWSPRVLASGGCIGIIEGHPRDKKRLRHLGYRTRAYMQEGLRLQGLPADYLAHCPFTVTAAIRAIGNAVPYPMARVVARAVRRALGNGEVRNG